MADSDMMTLGALWENTSAAGNVYFSGSLDRDIPDAIAEVLGGYKLMLFENKSENPKAPKYRVMLAPLKERTGPIDRATAEKDDVPF